MGFQSYRLRLEELSWQRFASLVETYKPDVIVNETLPFVLKSAQGYLANTVVATLHNIAYFYHVPIVQVSALSVQSKIALRKPNVKKISKVQVRNGVLNRLPDLTELFKDYSKIHHWDAIDAVAIGLYYQEYCVT